MAASVNYIVSTTKKFYQSKPANHGPDGPVEIKLRGKHRTGGMSPNWNRHSDNNNKAKPRVPRNQYNPLPKVMFMADAGIGHTVMITQEKLREVYGITVGFD